MVNSFRRRSGNVAGPISRSCASSSGVTRPVRISFCAGGANLAQTSAASAECGRTPAAPATNVAAKRFGNDTSPSLRQRQAYYPPKWRMIDRVISECRRIDRSNEAGLLIEQILNSDGPIRDRQQERGKASGGERGCQDG